MSTGHLYDFFAEMFINVFCPFIDWAVGFFFLLLLSCMSCLYILEIKPFSIVSFASIFPHYVGCLFVFFLSFFLNSFLFYAKTCKYD